MPLRKSTYKTDYLNQYLESGNVVDVIERGKDKYPVNALCSDCRFEDAITLVRKGCRILHDDCFAQELLDILYYLQVYSTICSVGQNKATVKEELKQLLIEEFNAFYSHDYSPEIIAAEFGFRLNIKRNRKLIDCIRKDFPSVYSELLKCDTVRDHFIPIVLLCNDNTFVQDFAKAITWMEPYEESVSRFSEGFEPVQEYIDGMPRLEVFRIFELADENTLQALNAIKRYQPLLISNELYWELCILVTVKRMRDFADGGDEFIECDVWDTEVLREYCPGAESILADMESALRTYMPESHRDNFFSRIISVLIDVCGYGNHCHYPENPDDFAFEEWEKPHECDLLVLGRAIDFYDKENPERLKAHDRFNEAERIREKAGLWREWYTSMDPAFSAPNTDDFYVDKYQIFLKYAELFSGDAN